MKRKYILIASGLLALAIIISGITFITSREFREKSLNIIFRPQKSLAGKQPDYRFEADYFYNLYQGSEAEADSIFIDRVIEVTGIIAGVVRENDGKVLVLLRDKFSFAGINCSMDERFINESVILKAGNAITIKGVCAGMLIDVVLMRCVVSE